VRAGGRLLKLIVTPNFSGKPVKSPVIFEPDGPSLPAVPNETPRSDSSAANGHLYRRGGALKIRHICKMVLVFWTMMGYDGCWDVIFSRKRR
jgi:hypothetical protein